MLWLLAANTAAIKSYAAAGVEPDGRQDRASRIGQAR